MEELISRAYVQRKIAEIYHQGSEDSLVLCLHHVIDEMNKIIASAPIVASLNTALGSYETGVSLPEGK